MFYFSGDVLLSFQLSYGGTVITPDDATIQIYSGDALINSGIPVLSGQYYNYVITVNDADILPDYYRSYRFLVTATYGGVPLVVNGYFVVHLSDYDNMDNTVVQLSNGNSEIFLSCADQTRQDCLNTPPVKPTIISVDMYKMNSAECDCVVKK